MLVHIGCFTLMTVRIGYITLMPVRLGYFALMSVEKKVKMLMSVRIGRFRLMSLYIGCFTFIPCRGYRSRFRHKSAFSLSVKHFSRIILRLGKHQKFNLFGNKQG